MENLTFREKAVVTTLVLVAVLALGVWVGNMVSDSPSSECEKAGGIYMPAGERLGAKPHCDLPGQSHD